MTVDSMQLPSTCAPALLARFLRAEAMALWAVRAARLQALPRHVHNFLQRHEQDEQEHLARFEALLGTTSQRPPTIPNVPSQWEILAVHLLGYEALGLEFAQLLVAIRPDLADILEDERVHVGFFERELAEILASADGRAAQARQAAHAWWARVPRTVDRYVQDDLLAPYRVPLRRRILTSIHDRFTTLGLLSAETASPAVDPVHT